MNISKIELVEAIKACAEEIAELIAKAAESTAKHDTASKVTVNYDIKHQKDNRMQLLLTATTKIKLPTATRTESITTSEPDLLAVWSIGEAPGQERIGLAP